MAENKNRMNNEPVFGSLAYDLNTLNWEQLDGNAVRQPQEPLRRPERDRIRSESCVRSIVSSWWRTMRRHMVACLRDGRPAHWETLQVIAFTRVRTWEPWVTEVR